MFVDAKLEPSAHLALARQEGDRVAAMPPDLLGAPVPGLDDWNVERVVRHLGKIHRWVSNLVTGGPDAELGAAAGAAAALPKGPDCLPAYQTSLDEMLVALEACDPGRPIATFAGAGTVAFWCRRMAHEIAIHRVDAADAVHAAGGPAPDPLDTRASLDGIDEWLNVFVASRGGDPSAPGNARLRGARLMLEAESDLPLVNRWMVAFDADAASCAITRLDVESPSADVEVTLSGPASALLLTCWRRRSIPSITTSGDDGVAFAFVDRMRF